MITLSFVYPVWCMGGVESYSFMMVENIPDCQFELQLVHPKETYQPWLEKALRLGVKLVDKTSGIRLIWGCSENGDLRISHGSGPWTDGWVHKAKGQAVAVSADAGQCFGSERFINIGQGVDLNRLTPSGRDLRQELGISPFSLLAGYIGRFSSEKNLHVLKGIKTRVLYHGKGHENVGMSLGPEVRVGDTLAAIDVLVYPSPKEGGPLAILEAWAAGVPVVCNKVGLVKEFEEIYGPLTIRMTKNIDEDILRAVSDTHKPLVEKARKIMWQYSAAALGRRWGDLLRSL